MTKRKTTVAKVPKPVKGTSAQSLALLREAAKGLRDRTEKKMFGCDALFTAGRIFALVWKTNRIALKITDEVQHDELMATKGAEPWKPDAKVMRHWVLVPADFDLAYLAPWVVLAWRNAQADAKPKKKTTTAKVATKSKGKKKSAKELFEIVCTALKDEVNIRPDTLKGMNCYGLLALVSKEGRIVVRLPDREHKKALLAAGGEVFHELKPKDWVVVPHHLEDVDSLRPWMARSHGHLDLSKYPLP